MIESGEDERTEFKSARSSDAAIARAVCGFLNRDGGRIIYGVSDEGEILGVPEGEVEPRVEARLRSLIAPQALWTAERMTLDDRDVIVIEIPEGIEKPYVTDGSIFVRRGASVAEASRDEIGTLIERRAEGSLRWERQVAYGSERDDLDDSLVVRTARKARDADRWRGATEEVDDFLHDLGLLAHGGITNAALLLFGTRPSRHLPQARVRLLVLPNGKTGDRYESDIQFDDCLLNVAEQLPRTLSTHAGGVESRFPEEEWPREDRPVYPPSALREGVMNALVHRDYSMSGSITISILPEALEISSPGALPGGLRPADLKRDHPSVPRNPDMAHAFFLDGLIEKVGRGTQRIVEECRKFRLPEPKWRSTPLETKLIFSAPSAHSKQEDLNDRQQRILGVVHVKRSVPARELVEMFSGVTARTVRNDLQSLVDGGWLIRRGKGPSTLYVSGRSKNR